MRVLMAECVFGIADMFLCFALLLFLSSSGSGMGRPYPYAIVAAPTICSRLMPGEPPLTRLGGRASLVVSLEEWGSRR